MSTADIDSAHPLELNQPRFSVKKPEPRYDKQGDMPDAQRVETAMRYFVKDFGAVAATYMESCIHCGMCAEACHFYIATENPKYTPIWKLEPFKQAYKREAGPFAAIYRALNLKKKVTVEQLEEWQELLYDSCTLCGRCTLICPMGIDIAALVGLARHGMNQAGLVPHELWAVAERAEREGSPLGATPKVFKERCEWLADDNEVEIFVDKAQADVVAAMSSIEIMKYPGSIVATSKILNHLGLNWTFRSDGYEATNFGMLSGNSAWQREASMKLINATIAAGAKLLILPECGHAYGAMRWQGANIYGKPLPFRVLHISEFLAENTKSGALKTKPLSKTMTFHDPCQVSRRGGAIEAPREVIDGLGAELIEMQDTKGLNWCCGGGGGVVTIHRADHIRYQAFQIKMKQIDNTGAEMLVSSCSNCRQTFDDGQDHFHWDKTMLSLLDLVADNLEDK
ncbi:sulfite reduction-associated complex DsrMKJOP protein DsrK (=HmeD) [Sulfuriferula multivorans]|uniref:Sulfite reduction-associated complex DsrMKJOP protein DsrK (=HmeD) n=1 Tax=Sulfuriferula multivorans TaxID=1559896 RepID=A0A401JYQ6_9PROT|nr:(Fe-S)-binding protein [Sulfuriferula multivorans]GCB02062.1 sulfite reduction-associated complex DsrMKJOP protein DsrK (=HmeD) [Sulfuriferula multivorans]